jgi:hypothetical protein
MTKKPMTRYDYEKRLYEGILKISRIRVRVNVFITRILIIPERTFAKLSRFLYLRDKK